MTVDQAGKYLGRSPAAIRTLLRKAIIKRVDFDDDRVMFDKRDLDRVIEERKA